VIVARDVNDNKCDCCVIGVGLRDGICRGKYGVFGPVGYGMNPSSDWGEAGSTRRSEEVLVEYFCSE
jgi:hypothetical protein